MTTTEKAHESRCRRLAARTGWGYRLCKGRGALHSNNHGQYQLVNHNNVVLGSDYDASLDYIETFLHAHCGA
jgi:hypothetical protein